MYHNLVHRATVPEYGFYIDYIIVRSSNANKIDVNFRNMLFIQTELRLNILKKDTSNDIEEIASITEIGTHSSLQIRSCTGVMRNIACMVSVVSVAS